MDQAIRKLETKYLVWAAKQSMVIHVRFSAASPELAHDVVEQVTKVFLAEHAKLNQNDGSLEFFAEQTDKLRRDLAAAQTELQTLKARAAETQEMFDASETVRRNFGDQVMALQDQLKQMESALTSSQTEAVRLADENTQLKNRAPAAMPDDTATLRNQLAAAERTVAEAQRNSLALAEENTRLRNAVASAAQMPVRSAPTRSSGSVATAPTRPTNVPPGTKPAVQYTNSPSTAASPSAPTLRPGDSASAPWSSHPPSPGARLAGVAPAPRPTAAAPAARGAA
jgi:hypothetical protein